MTGDFPGNFGKSGWAPKDRSKSAQSKTGRKWYWWLFIIVASLCVIYWAIWS